MRSVGLSKVPPHPPSTNYHVVSQNRCRHLLQVRPHRQTDALLLGQINITSNTNVSAAEAVKAGIEAKGGKATICQ